jgi:hypothetical protein
MLRIPPFSRTRWALGKRPEKRLQRAGAQIGMVL